MGRVFARGRLGYAPAGKRREQLGVVDRAASANAIKICSFDQSTVPALPRASTTVSSTTSSIAWRWHVQACALAQAAATPVCTAAVRPPSGLFQAGSRRPARPSPAHHRGLLRRGAADPAVPVSILVDSGSQQAPLCSERVAQSLGGKGSLVSFATQAGGQPLPIYDVGWCQLGVNGRAAPTCFKTAPIAPYDVILGEDWMHENRIVLDYADSVMLQKDAVGRLMPFSFDNMLPSGSTPVATPPPLIVPPPVCAGSRLRRSERRHDRGLYDRSLLHAVLDVDKELPEDDALDLGEIPGVSPADRTAFSFIEEDVRLRLDHLPAPLVEEVVTRLRVFEDDVFETRTMPRLAPARDFDVEIVEKPGSQPPARRPYPVALHHRAELDRQVQVLLDAGIVRRSFSPYAAPVLFSPKKDGKLRLCIDYRGLNLQTVRDRFPTPTAADLIAKTRGAQWFSKIDLHSGFHQLRIREQDVHKTAFSTPSGLFEFVTAPFGLTNVPGCFQRFMQHVLAEHIEKGYCVVYCDDVAIFSTDEDPLVHLQHVEAVLTSLRQHQLLAKGSKCELMRREAEFLGFMVSGHGVRPLPSKVEAVLQVPAPETISHLRSFLGLCNFFRSHRRSLKSRHRLRICSKAASMVASGCSGLWRVSMLSSSLRLCSPRLLCCDTLIPPCVQQCMSTHRRMRWVQSYSNGRRGRLTRGPSASCLASSRVLSIATTLAMRNRWLLRWRSLRGARTSLASGLSLCPTMPACSLCFSKRRRRTVSSASASSLPTSISRRSNLFGARRMSCLISSAGRGMTFPTISACMRSRTRAQRVFLRCALLHGYSVLKCCFFQCMISNSLFLSQVACFAYLRRSVRLRNPLPLLRSA